MEALYLLHIYYILSLRRILNDVVGKQLQFLRERDKPFYLGQGYTAPFVSLCMETGTYSWTRISVPAGAVSMCAPSCTNQP